jgi:aminoglycoside 6-adenylyltransferase
VVDFDPERDAAAFERGSPPRFGEEDEGARLVIFEGGRKVDFSLVPLRVLEERVRSGATEQASWRGYRVLLDRDGLAARLVAPDRPPLRQQPSTEEFATAAEEFWFEAYHVAKYLARGDLWPANVRDWGTKTLLLRMLEWHARSLQGWDLDTWHLGIRLREWAGPEAWGRLHGVFGRFDADDGWRALAATTELVRSVAVETAARLGYPYPTKVGDAIGGYIGALRARATAPRDQEERP